jgi:phytoene dehydrogenase-like protein
MRSAGEWLDHCFRGVVDTTAPTPAHDASLFCQHYSYNPPGGRDRRQEKQSAIDRHLTTVDSYAPHFSANVVGHSALGPLDLEEKLGLAGGDIFHDAPALDQPWAARPMLGTVYRTPVKKLYL